MEMHESSFCFRNNREEIKFNSQPARLASAYRRSIENMCLYFSDILFSERHWQGFPFGSGED